LKNIPSIIACSAALGLMVLTGATIVRPAADLSVWRVAIMALAWVAIAAAALATRERGTTTTADTETAVQEAEHRQPETGSTALFEFAREVHGTLESDKLRLLISQRLPVLVGVTDVWIVAQLAGRQQVIVPALSGVDPTTLISEEPRQWATYPMKADGRTLGVMGAALPTEGFTREQQKLFREVASFVAQALTTASAFETMREASLVDALTGCATRAEGTRRLEAELRRSHRSGTALAVLMMDLDHFKSINDRFGHKAGDAALMALGETLLMTLRASDVRCRWGGEEFLLVLPDANVERAQRAADKLRQTIANTPIAAGDQLIYVTASIGLTLSAPGETDVQQLIARADAGLYDAKRNGRNRTSIRIAPPSSRPGATGARAAAPAERAAPAGPQLRTEPTLNGTENEWNGIERRNPTRGDRRAFPGPGRRMTDAIVAELWRES